MAGEVTVDVVATIRTSTSATLQISEDVTGDGTTDNFESITLQNGTTSRTLDTFDGGTDSRIQIDLSLETTHRGRTPEIHSVVVTAAGVEPIGYATFDPNSVSASYRIPIFAEADVESTFVWATLPDGSAGCAALVSPDDSPLHAVNPVSGETHGVLLELE